MKNLKVWQKLAVMGGVLMLPFGVVTYKMASSINTLGTEFAQQEIRGLEYYTPALALLRDLQQHRGMAAARLSGDASFEEPLAAKRTDIENDIKKLNEIDERLDGTLHTTQKWTALRAACGDLLRGGQNLSASDSFERHTKAIEDTIALIKDVGDTSNLTLDPDIDSYYLMNIVIFQGPELGELLARARGLGASLVASGNRTPEQLARFTELSILAGFVQKSVDDSVLKALDFNESLEPQLGRDLSTSAAAVQEARAGIAKLADARNTGMSASDYYGLSTRSVDSIFEMEERVAASLNALLHNRVEKFRGEVLETLAWAGLGLLVVSIFAFVIMRDITVTLGGVVAVANRIAIGDLTTLPASTARKDEIGVLAQAFDRMVSSLKEKVGVAQRIAAGDLAVVIPPRSEHDVMGNALADMVRRLSMLVGEVQRSGIQVNASVNEIAATSKQQQSTATEIAATTTEIGATSKEISATSKELVKTMTEVSSMAGQSATLAGTGQAGLTRMEETMRQVMAAAGSINAKLAVLNQRAGSITQVVTTITKVADQTNLLSLNAAIEAEKAGEYGRGFAVVATEIRRLADQTAVATYDIEQMVKEIQSAVSAGVMGMDKFSEEVRRAMQDVQQVGDQLSQIIHQTQELAPRFEAVTEGMEAQATGAEQITLALGQLSDAVQQTVESLRESSHVIDGLNEAATGMQSGVSRFNLAA